MHHALLHAALICAVLFAVTQCAELVHAQLPPELLKAWKDREDKTSSLQFLVTEVFREDRHRFEAKHKFYELRLQGSFLDFRRAEGLTPEKLGPLPKSRTVFDNKTYTQYTAARSVGRKGSLLVDQTPNPTLTDANYAHARPLMLHFRGLNPQFGRVSESTYRLIPGTHLIGDRACLMLEEGPNGTPIQQFYWVDPARDFIVLQGISRIHGKDSVRHEISYARQSDGWQPTHWKTTVVDYETGKLLMNVDCDVASFELNRRIPEGEFRIDPDETPEGTRVSDVVNGHGRLRLAASQSSKRPSYWAPLSAIAAIAAGVFILIFVRLRRSSK